MHCSSYQVFSHHTQGAIICSVNCSMVLSRDRTSQVNVGFYANQWAFSESNLFTVANVSFVIKQNKCGVSFSSTHPLKPLVLKIQVWFTICFTEFNKPQLYYRDASTAVLMCFMVTMQTHPFATLSWPICTSVCPLTVENRICHPKPFMYI